MDKTGKTFNTADQTQLYPSYMYNQPGPAFVGSRTLPVSGVQTSQVSMMQSSPQNIMQGPIMRGPVGQVPQAMPYPVNGNVINRPVMANTVPIAGPRPMPIVPPTVIQRPLLMPQALQINPIRIDDQVQVYCPVCKRAYSNFQAESHALIHDGTPYYNFKQPSDLSTSNSSNAGLTQYPLVQPMQFWTNQLADSHKNDVFIFKDNKNYDGVERELFNRFNFGTHETSVQTANKPPLQYESNHTNLYNCLDNAVNPKNGPKFAFSDLCANNEWITPKRPLDEWELMQKGQNQKTLTIPFLPFKN